MIENICAGGDETYLIDILIFEDIYSFIVKGDDILQHERQRRSLIKHSQKIERKTDGRLHLFDAILLYHPTN